MIKTIRFTKEGYQQLEKDFLDFKVQRKEAVIRLTRARDLGDLSENGAYKAARLELGSIDRSIRRLKFLLSSGEVVETKNNDHIDFGSRVTLNDGKKQLVFTMVEGFESDPSQQKLSVHSPIGKAIVGKHIGDKVKVAAPSGSMEYSIVAVE